MKDKTALLIIGLVLSFITSTFIITGIAKAKEDKTDIDLTTGLLIQDTLQQAQSLPSLLPLTENVIGGTILWDKTHGVFSNYEPSGNYSDLSTMLQSVGYTITTTTNISGVTLSDYDVLVVNLNSAWDTT